MSANILESFFVALGFEVDTTGLDAMKKKTEELRNTALAMGAIFTTAAAGLGLFVAKVAEGLDDLGDFAERENVAIEMVQELGHAAQLNGSSIEALKASISGVNKSLGEAALGVGRAAMVFQKLGLEAKKADGSVKTFDELLYEVADKMDGMSRQEQIAMAEKLGIDRSLIPMLRKGRAEIQKLREEAQAFVATEADAAKAGALMDSLDRTRFILGALGRYIAVAFMPQVTSVLEGFRGWILANEKIIKSGLGTALKVLTSIVGTLWDWAMRLVNALIGLVKWLDSFSTATKIAAAVALALGAALAVPGAAFGLVAAAVLLLIDELVNFYEGNETLIGQMLEDFPNAGKAVVVALGTIAAAFVALKWQAVSAWAATALGAVRSAAMIVLAATTISGGLLPLIGIYVSMAASAVAAGAAAAAAWLAAIAPIALVIAAIVAVGAAIYALWANWDEVTTWLGDAWDAVTAKVMGFVDLVSGAISKVGQLFGLSYDDSKTRLALGGAGGAVSADQATANNSLNATGGVIGSAGSNTTNSSTVTQTTQITGTTIQINSPDPAKAGESVRQEFEKMNKQTVRNGQSAVAL